MNSKKKTIIICSIAVVLLAVVLVILLLTKPSDKDGESSASSLTTYSMIEQDRENLTSMTVKNETGEYTFGKVGDDEYGIPALSQYEQETSYALTAVNNISTLNAHSKVADSVDDKAKYGLDNPSITVTAIFGEKTYVLIVGKQAYDEGYYAMLEGDSTLYTITATVQGELVHSQWYYLKKALIPASSSDSQSAVNTIQSVTFTRSDLTQPIKVQRYTGDTNDRLYTSNFTLVSPIVSELNDDADLKYIDVLVSGTASDILGAYSAADAAKYGFDNPSAIIEIVQTDRTDKIIVGNKNEDTDNYYTLIEGRDLVYDVSEGTLAYAMSVTTDDMISPYPVLSNLVGVSSVDVTVNGTKHTFNVTNKEEKSSETSGTESSDESSTVSTTAVDYNGKSVDVDNFKQYFQLLLAAPADQVYTGAAGTEVGTITIVYHYENGKTDTVELTNLGSRRMAIAVNGTIKYEGRSAYLDKLQSETQKIIDGKKVDIDW